ncbi:MAG: hypothetical protein CFE43_03705 [Burkholderiales bacterium PBB3]|nr:MAG: hypothetical protein CFE43_03705 [Burkholderiales bacterium PBB3]
MQTSKDKKSKWGSQERWLDNAPLIAICAALLLLALYLVPISYPLQKRSDAWGQFGDFMGGLLNPLISLLTLFVAVAVWRLQKKELQETNIAFIKQNTQQTFFNLLQQHRELVNGVELTADHQHWHQEGMLKAKYTGRSAFAIVVSTLSQEDRGNFTPDIVATSTKSEKFTCASTTSFESQLMFSCWYIGKTSNLLTSNTRPFPNALEMSFGHIFRSIFQILKFAAHAPGLTVAERRDLVNYLRAQMSEDEFVLYALSSLTQIGEKSRAVSIVFDFFENRMQTLKWASPMLDLLSQTDKNLEFAQQNGFSPLED